MVKPEILKGQVLLEDISETELNKAAGIIKKWPLSDKQQVLSHNLNSSLVTKLLI